MRVLLVANFSTPRCGFQNYATQMTTALQRAGVDVTTFDGTYPQVYARIQEGLGDAAYFPPDVASYDVVHLVWHPATMNHYGGARYPSGPLYSFWNGQPVGASCPFQDKFHLSWSPIPTPGHEDHFYPIVDWIDDLPAPDPPFTVGVTGVRQEGFEQVAAVCEKHGWVLNAPTAGVWLSIEDEIKRLARSTINVCWYSDKHPDRSGGVMTALAAKRPVGLSKVQMFDHLREEDGSLMPDLFWAQYHESSLERMLLDVRRRWDRGEIRLGHYGNYRQPSAETWDRFRWTRAVERFLQVWSVAR